MKHHTLKPGFGIGLAVLALSLSMCKKNAVTEQMPGDKTAVAKPGLIPSPAYNLSEKQNYQLVMDFKEHAGMAARGGPDSLAVDSAQYVLEASINYDFDSPAKIDFLEISNDVSSYPFNIDASARPSRGYIYSADVTALSTALHNHFDAIVAAGSNIAAIDVVAYIDDASTGQGHFEVTASVMSINSQPYRCATSIWNAATNYPNANWSEINGIFSCGLWVYNPPQNGVRLQFQAAMNCRDLYYAGCSNGYYFPVVSTVNTTAYSGDPRLFYATAANSLFFCNGSVGFLSGASYNSKLANAKNYVLNNVATSPGGLSLVDNSTTVTLGGYQVPQSAAGVLYWNMSFQKGVRNCRPIPNG